MEWVRRCLILGLMWVLSPVVGLACSDAPNMPAPRIILALYDGSAEGSPRDSRIHRYLEFPLNHMGFRLDYVDVTDANLPPVTPPEVAAILSWFDRPVPEAAGFARWAASVDSTCAGTLKQIVFGDPGLPVMPGGSADQAAYLARLGIGIAGAERVFGIHAVVTQHNLEMVGVEASFVIRPDRYPGFQATSAGQSLLRVQPDPKAGDGFVDLVVVGPQGGFVHEEASVTLDPREGRSLWITDPFALLNAVLGPRAAPVPDVTTLNGRRLFFVTVGAQGWLALLPARQFDDEPKSGSEMLLEHLIAPYPDLPFSVGVVTGDLDPTLAGRVAPTGLAVARAVYALPNVAIASFGASFVRDWDFFAQYDSASEGQMIDRLRDGAAGNDRPGGLVNAAMRGLAGAALGNRTLTNRLSDAPRDYTRDVFDVESEVTRALEVTTALAPPDRRATLYLWSGNARPFEAALAAARRSGVAAIGGGGGMMTSLSPSLSGLSPLSAPVGNERQVYDALSGDEAYTNYWTEPSHGFHDYAETLERTEHPRRLKPFHLSVSAQSALTLGTRRAVRAMLDRARVEEVIPVSAADYAGYVAGFHTIRVLRAGPAAWRILDRGSLQTLRLDDADNLLLDLPASNGVLGARRKDGNLYVALNPQIPSPLVTLARGDDPSGMRTGTEPGLVESRLTVAVMETAGCVTRIGVNGRGAGTMTLFAPPTSPLSLSVNGAAPQTVLPDAAGLLRLMLPDPAGQMLSLTLTRPC